MGGGGGSGARILASVEIFDPATETWTLVTPMRHARLGHVMFALPDNRVVVAGGTDDPDEGERGTLRSAEIYDPDLDRWTDLPDMLQSRWAATGAVFGNVVYMAGGYDSVDIVSTVERLTIPSKETPRADSGSGESAGCSVPSGSDRASLGIAVIIGLVVIAFGVRRGYASV